MIVLLTVCGKISKDIDFNCDTPLQAGAEDELVLINRDDWLNAAITVDGANAQLVTDIVLGSGVEAYVYQGKNNSIVPKYEFIKQTFAEVYNHEINFKIFNVDADIKDQLEKLAKGTMVAIVQNKFKGANGNAAYEIYGADSGLVTTQNLREITNQENQGAFDLIIKSDETSLEPHMPKTLFNTDFATTKAIVDGLSA